MLQSEQVSRQYRYLLYLFIFTLERKSAVINNTAKMGRIARKSELNIM